MPKLAKNKYDLVGCVQWYVQHLVGKGDSADESMEVERRLLVRAQRRRHELEIAKRRGELIDAETVGQVINELAVIFVTQLEGMGARVAQQVATMSDPGAIQRVLTDECRGIRQATAARVADFAGAYHVIGDIDPAPRRKRRRVGRPAANTPA